MKKVVIYTDGSCSMNPGPGGWAAILIYGTKKIEISGGDSDTTNNKMELTATIKALEKLKEPCEVALYSDSTYVVNAFQENWINKWISNNWRKSDRKSFVSNVELWKRLYELTKIHKVIWLKVKGHSDNIYNNRCDELAKIEAAKYIKKNKNSMIDDNMFFVGSDDSNPPF